MPYSLENVTTKHPVICIRNTKRYGRQVTEKYLFGRDTVFIWRSFVMKMDKRNFFIFHWKLARFLLHCIVW
jgi:hypothetical protein